MSWRLNRRTEDVLNSQLNSDPVSQQAVRSSGRLFQVLVILVYGLTRTKGMSPLFPGQVDKVVVVRFADNPQTWQHLQITCAFCKGTVSGVWFTMPLLPFYPTVCKRHNSCMPSLVISAFPVPRKQPRKIYSTAHMKELSSQMEITVRGRKSIKDNRKKNNMDYALKPETEGSFWNKNQSIASVPKWF